MQRPVHQTQQVMNVCDEICGVAEPSYLVTLVGPLYLQPPHPLSAVGEKEHKPRFS